MSRPLLEVADIFRDHGAAWRQANAGHVSLGQMKVMSAIERCRTAALDRTHDLHLAEADMAGIGFAPRCPMVAEDIRDLQRWTGHRRYAVGWSLLPLSLALFGSLWLSWTSYEAATAGQAGSRCRRSGRLRRACSAPSCPICRDPAMPG